MAGIVITGIENIDEEPDYEKLAKERAARLREDRLRRTRAIINENQEVVQQTSVEVQNTPKGTKTKTTTSTDGIKKTETVETDVNEVEESKEQKEIEGFDQSQIDSKKEEELLKQGVDTSDIKNGEETKRESIPDKPKNNPKDPVVNKNKNNGNADTKSEHCSIDDKKPQEKEDQNVLIGEDPNAPKSEIIIPDKSATCPSPNLNSLNDFQKEVIWVALDMLKWQPTTDVSNEDRGKSNKAYWDYLEKSNSTKPSFYNKYTYPNDPTFGRFKHKGSDMLPLDRLFTLYKHRNKKNPPPDKADKKTAWCAITASVIYMYAFIQMRAEYTGDISKVKNNGTAVWSPFEDKVINIPFTSHAGSQALVATQNINFGYKLSFEPTPGSIFFKVNNAGTGGCGHAGIVVDVTKDKSIILLEGNASDDYHIRVWPRDTYYQDAWRTSHEASYVKQNIFGGNGIADYKKCTDEQIRKGRKLKQNGCGTTGTADYPWSKTNRPSFPTDSNWHWTFVNPSTETELLDIKGKPSRDGNPLPEIYTLLDGFYNPAGSKGAGNDSKTT